MIPFLAEEDIVMKISMRHLTSRIYTVFVMGMFS